MRKIAAGLAAGALGVALLASPALAEDGCNGDASNPLCPTMDDKTAGDVYLEYMCPVNRASAAYNRAIDRYDSRDSYGDKPSAKTRKAARKAARASEKLAEAFDGGYTYAGFWPDSVAADMQSIATMAFDNAGAFYAIAAKGYRWDDPSFSDYSSESSAVRLALGLPPRGRGC